MAVLIVDPDDQARETLHRLAGRLGLGPVWEASDGETAWRIMLQRHRRLRFCLSAAELPGSDGLLLLRQMEANPQLSAAAFLLVLSGDERDMARRSLLAKHPRLDGVLRKPFGAPRLRRSLREGYARRLRTRTTLAYLGRDRDWQGRLAEGIARDVYWEKLVELGTLADLRATHAGAAAKFGALLVDWSGFDSFETGEIHRWLSFQRKQVSGRMPVVVGINRREEDCRTVGGLRAHLQLSVPAGSTPDAMRVLLERLRRRIATAWERERFCAAIADDRRKRRLRAGRWVSPRKALERMARRLVRHDPGSVEAHQLLGETGARTGKLRRGITHLERAIEANPYHPGPYLRLMELSANFPEISRLERWVSAASEHCPRHRQVLAGAAQFWRRHGREELAEPLLLRLRELDKVGAVPS